MMLVTRFHTVSHTPYPRFLVTPVGPRQRSNIPENPHSARLDHHRQRELQRVAEPALREGPEDVAVCDLDAVISMAPPRSLPISPYPLSAIPTKPPQPLKLFRRSIFTLRAPRRTKCKRSTHQHYIPPPLPLHRAPLDHADPRDQPIQPRGDLLRRPMHHQSAPPPLYIPSY